MPFSVQRASAVHPTREDALALDFRSDTVTQPTARMRQAMASADVGDDVYGEDPTVNLLEAEAARLFGKESAVLAASGTQGNLLALLSQTRPGDEIILEAATHIANSEVDGYARLAGLGLRTIARADGKIRPQDIGDLVRPTDIHYARTALAAVENTHNSAGGAVYSVSEMNSLADAAHAHGLRLHVDGARIFNAAVALGVDVATLTRAADSVQFCLSKGLGAPVGSLLVSDAQTVERARGFRKMLGGGMRQAGILAAAGLIAMKEGPARLSEDHRLARRLALGLASIPGIEIDLSSVQTNIVRFTVAAAGHSSVSFAEAMLRLDVKVSGGARARVRIVTHQHITDASVETALDAARQACAGGPVSPAEGHPALHG